MNCDHPSYSEFFSYFKDNFNTLELKQLTATYLGGSTRTDVVAGKSSVISITPMETTGDFRDAALQEIIEECDLIITNPPFSLFREYVQLLIQNRKQFLIIGSINALTYKEIFPLIRDNKIWLGTKTGKMEFNLPDSKETQSLGNITWYTNLDHAKRHQPLELTHTYQSADYPKYDNYEAIEVGRVNRIPKDYEGVMGVPITYLTKHSQQQFKIIGMASGNSRANQFNGTVGYRQHKEDRGGCAVLEGKRKYPRLLIKRV